VSTRAGRRLFFLPEQPHSSGGKIMSLVERYVGDAMLIGSIALIGGIIAGVLP
jgi:hypothetical protein